MFRLVVVLLALIAGSDSYAHTVTSTKGSNSVSARIDFSATCIPTTAVDSNLILVDNEVTGVYKLVVKYNILHVEDAGIYATNFLVVDPFDILGESQIEVAMNDSHEINVSTPNEFVVAVVWPNTLTNKEVVALFKHNYGDGVRLAINLKFNSGR